MELLRRWRSSGGGVKIVPDHQWRARCFAIFPFLVQKRASDGRNFFFAIQKNTALLENFWIWNLFQKLSFFSPRLSSAVPNFRAVTFCLQTSTKIGKSRQFRRVKNQNKNITLPRLKNPLLLTREVCKHQQLWSFCDVKNFLFDSIKPIVEKFSFYWL